MTTACKTGLCAYKKFLGGCVGVFVAGAMLFFSCGKPDEKAKDGTGPEDAGDVELHLTFEAYTDETVDTFRIYAGTSKDTLKLADTFATEGTAFDYTKPEITVESNGNTVVSALLGGQGCFQLRAVKADVESDGSNLVCTDL